MKHKLFLLCTFLLLTAGITNSYAATNSTGPKTETSVPPTNENPRLEEIKRRVEEIKNMDRSSLTRSERKALKKELRELSREGKKITGVYLSVGAIIIIILLLILIL